MASLESQGQRSTDDCSKIRPSPVDHILDSDQRDNFVESPSTSRPWMASARHWRRCQDLTVRR